MARITIRDLPDETHVALGEAASENHRSTEGEIRYALQEYIERLSNSRKVVNDSRRVVWQQEVGERLQQLFTQLSEDEVLGYGHRHDVPQFALMLKEESPAYLMDCMDGLETPSFELLKRIANQFSCSEGWLTSGVGSMFPMPSIGSRYEEFFQPAIESSDIEILLVRICGGRSDGTLLCFRIQKDNPYIATGFIGEHFYLGAGMGATGHGNYNRFAEFLRSNCQNIRISVYNYEDAAKRWKGGEHHPHYYMSPSRISRAGWLLPLFNGEDPSKINWVAA
ncbi:hypothetical protein VPH49_20340 [Pseudomonas luteola]|uniref:FitA-like ribbon-helix-helix domain-containing protein n=1 Tax=Pseudomonas luteola TaxID=47886 RepID=UPI003A842293